MAGDGHEIDFHVINIHRHFSDCLSSVGVKEHFFRPKREKLEDLSFQSIRAFKRRTWRTELRVLDWQKKSVKNVPAHPADFFNGLQYADFIVDSHDGDQRCILAQICLQFFQTYLPLGVHWTNDVRSRVRIIDLVCRWTINQPISQPNQSINQSVNIKLWISRTALEYTVKFVQQKRTG